MSGHTPGPWEFGVTSKADFWIGTDDADVAIVEGWTHELAPESLANARLIAAAPTMHEYIAQRAEVGDNEAKKILESINAGR